ncbi:hypothetical protein JXA56_00800, partial [Candidatus Micrarchaeota archaeon]|nr:hypothetical protein [Candidatus Micrarchaeota archaeon]
MRHQNKNILKNPRFVLGAGATSLAMITALQIFSSCKSESENIQKSHAEAANNSGIAGLYDYVQ